MGAREQLSGAHVWVNWSMDHLNQGEDVIGTKVANVYSKSTGLEKGSVTDAVAWHVGELNTTLRLLGVFQLMLHLAVLGEIHGGDLLGLLDLALVGLDLGLELLNEILHALHVLAVFLGLEGEFLESSVGLAEVLGGLLVAALFGIELGLEFADAGLELGDDALASLEGGGLSLLEASLELSDG